MPATTLISDTSIDCGDCGCLHRTDVNCPWGPGRYGETYAERNAAAPARTRTAAAHTGTRTQSIGTDLDATARHAHTPTAPARRTPTTGRRTATPAKTTGKTMTAKFDGKCSECPTRINAGDTIVFTKGAGSRHAECPDAPAAPVATAPAARMATAPQITLIETLQAERGQPVGAPESLTFDEAQVLIPELIRMPKISAGDRRIDLCGCPEGRYAVHTDEGHYAFYNVTERGVFLQLSDSLNAMPEIIEQAIIAKIMTDVAEAARAYGRELGQCWCGRTLTNEVSRKYGIGPVCRKNMGW